MEPQQKLEYQHWTSLTSRLCYKMHNFIYIYVMEWWRVEGQDTGSGVSKNGDHSRRTAALRFYCTAADNFQHTQNHDTHIDKRMAQATRNTCYRYNQIGPLDHKMADNCVSLASTNTVSSTITKLIKTWKTPNTKSPLPGLSCLSSGTSGVSAIL